jgi:hypothetical protein
MTVLAPFSELVSPCFTDKAHPYHSRGVPRKGFARGNLRRGGGMESGEVRSGAGLILSVFFLCDQTANLLTNGGLFRLG